MRPMRGILVAAILALSEAAAFAGQSVVACVGDCDGDGRVTVAELVRAVGIALGTASLDRCALADANGNGAVAINELVLAVNAALGGCPPLTPSALPTGTPTASPTATDVATPSPTATADMPTASPTATVPTEPWTFTDVAEAAGVLYSHVVEDPVDGPQALMAGGVAAGDYDGDGWVDLYAAGGDAQPNLLLRNQRDGTFADAGLGLGLPEEPMRGAAFAFADIDGDDTPDLFLGGVDGARPRIFGGRTDGRFTEETSPINFTGFERDTFSSALADYDRDGDLDLCLSRWGTPRPAGGDVEHLFRNDGDWRMTPIGIALGVAGFDAFHGGGAAAERDLTLTPSFADLNDDGWQDLVFAADGGSGQVFLNDGAGAFVRSTDAAISDENGKGAALGDYDNDGDIDWFVSGTWDPNGVAEGDWGISGNRLYRNRGDGSFEDATDEAGVREGYWGWAACFADFDNDGDLDLFQVNGFSPAESDEFDEDPSRLFLNDGLGSFTESSARVGLIDTSQGRGVVCFDYDRDGDVDIFVAANDGPSRLWRNDGGNRRGRHLKVRLAGRAPNPDAIGARVSITTNGVTQIREVRAGSNFASQNPAEAHFGLGTAIQVDTLHVRWPRGETTELQNVAADQVIEITQP